MCREIHKKNTLIRGPLVNSAWRCRHCTQGSREASREVSPSDILPAKVADPSVLIQLRAQSAHVSKVPACRWLCANADTNGLTLEPQHLVATAQPNICIYHTFLGRLKLEHKIGDILASRLFEPMRKSSHATYHLSIFKRLLEMFAPNWLVKMMTYLVTTILLIVGGTYITLKGYFTSQQNFYSGSWLMGIFLVLHLHKPKDVTY